MDLQVTLAIQKQWTSMEVILMVSASLMAPPLGNTSGALCVLLMKHAVTAHSVPVLVLIYHTQELSHHL